MMPISLKFPLLAVAFAMLTAPLALAGGPREMAVTFMDTKGEGMGRATLVDGPAGLLIRLELRGLPPGEHAIHIHEKSACTPRESDDGAAYFSNAGGHYNPTQHRHGILDGRGLHAGDLPNIFADREGRVRAHIFNRRISLGETDSAGATRADLLAGDGTALIIHKGTDDYKSQPSGDAGPRIGCAPIVAE